MSTEIQNTSTTSPWWKNKPCACLTVAGLFIPVVGIIAQIFLNKIIEADLPAEKLACKPGLDAAKESNQISLLRNVITLGALAAVITTVALGVLGGGAVLIGAAAITAAVVLIDSAFRIKAIKEYGDRADALAIPQLSFS